MAPGFNGMVSRQLPIKSIDWSRQSFGLQEAERSNEENSEKV
jgi:hypothetical protein